MPLLLLSLKELRLLVPLASLLLLIDIFAMVEAAMVSLMYVEIGKARAFAVIWVRIWDESSRVILTVEFASVMSFGSLCVVCLVEVDEMDRVLELELLQPNGNF